MVTNQRIDRVVRILKRLVRQWKEPVVGHYRDDPFATLISCLLSLRTKDETTHAASRRLFALARSPRAMLELPIPTIERAIYPVGFYHTKARTIQAVCRTLLDRYGGRVPHALDELLTIKGVGRKTANLVVTLAYRQPGICVDTHVHRITNRWGYVRTRTPEQTEMALRKQLPKRHWIVFNDLLVTFGQNLCHPTSPWCSRCPLDAFCPKLGVTRSR
ncbi:MAG TPA: endonuclease III [Candidatus Omnitrophica bacterium]|nr:endonuclease III [Candidatus Omnitrophota bacterium]HBG72109.1 endonuclease III [Deltaproteobacteria bacterium]HBH96701.1 endonuclease III [Candidatus Omnitrophota bacterium]HBQ38903.1 endonuclease III [Candidatus Omnitrophota bacterium]